MSDESIRSSTFSQEDLQQFQSFYAPWKECFLTQDYDGMAALYTEDTVVMPPNQPTVVGRDAVRDWMASFPRVTRAEFKIDEVEGIGKLAFVRGRYSMTLEPEGAPGPVDDEGKYIEIRERQPDGSWLLARDIFNSDLAPGG